MLNMRLNMVLVVVVDIRMLVPKDHNKLTVGIPTFTPLNCKCSHRMFISQSRILCVQACTGFATHCWAELSPAQQTRSSLASWGL